MVAYYYMLEGDFVNSNSVDAMDSFDRKSAEVLIDNSGSEKFHEDHREFDYRVKISYCSS
jgi:hypothetical protein